MESDAILKLGLSLVIACSLALGAGCTTGGCKADNDCKGTRVCENGACVQPIPSVQPSAATSSTQASPTLPPSAPALATSAPTLAPTVPTTDDSIGVPECDAYIARYEACLINPKTPPEVQAKARQAIQLTKDAWRQAAATAAGKDALRTVCLAAVNNLNTNPMCK